MFWTCKGQLALERHGGRTLAGVCVRVALRLLALAARLIHNYDIGDQAATSPPMPTDSESTI